MSIGAAPASMLRKVGKFESHQGLFNGVNRVVESRFVDEHGVRAIGRNAQDADVRFSQRSADLRDETDHREVEHRVEAYQSPPLLNDHARKTRRQFTPGVFGDDQGDLLLVTRQRDEVIDRAQTGDRFAVLVERKAHHGKSRFRQVETYGHKITRPLSGEKEPRIRADATDRRGLLVIIRRIRANPRFLLPNYLLATDGHPDLRNSSFNFAIVASTSSSLRGIAADMFTGSSEVTRTSSSMRTPTPLYFSKAGRTALMNRSFSGVLDKTSSASGRI